MVILAKKRRDGNNGITQVPFSIWSNFGPFSRCQWTDDDNINGVEIVCF